MKESAQRALNILRDLGALPAVPFFEDGPAAYVMELLQGLTVKVERDDYGNIVAHYDRAAVARPPVAFVAHMDHPGFEIVSRDGSAYRAEALGGVPAASLRKPTPVLVLGPGGRRIPAQAEPYGEQGSQRSVTVRLRSDEVLEPPVPVVFDLPDFALDGGLIRMRALDDLAGCAGILAALERLSAAGAEADVYAVFTRAEEVGLFGARLLAEVRHPAPGDAGRLRRVERGGAGSLPGRGPDHPRWRRSPHLRRRRGAAPDGREPVGPGAQPRVPAPAAAHERRRLRGHRLWRLRLQRNGHRLPTGQLP